ncbi:TonB-dependent receptor [Treponema rectale]|uniref:TonB-dependent receptor n=1 Tax=Treponema rectale TaxID=744512 RepID=A0A7M1XKJ8_9SPIR|nr:TonB-dependent receptor [Treponema rectale]QOS40256.1 TonB-dependent receptor [Treponema rectale]
MRIFSHKSAVFFFTAAFVFYPFFSQENSVSASVYAQRGVEENSSTEGVVANDVDAQGDSQRTPLEEEDINLGHIYTFIESPEVEQRQVFNSQDIQKSHTESLVDFLQSEGMQLLSYGPYGLEAKPQIRGFTDETVRVVIDGICVNNAQYGTFDFTSIDINDIERMEIVRGGFTEGVSDEGSVAGTIYITTKKQALGTSVTTDSFVKSFFNEKSFADTFSQSAGISHQFLDSTFLKLNLRGTYAQNRFQFRNYMNKLVTRDNALVKDFHGDAKVSHFFGNGSSFTGGVLFYDGIKNCPGTSTSVSEGVQKDLNAMVNFSLVNPAVKNVFRLENSGAWIFNRRNYDESNSSSLHLINTFRYASYAEADFNDFYTQSAGLTLDAVNLDSTDDGKHLQFSFTVKETSVFRFSKHVIFTLPLAVKTCGSNAAFIPKAGVKIASEYADFIVNAYRMVQFPNMDDLYWESSYARGNPDLKIEEGWGGEFTVNWKKFIPLSACFFTNYYENKIQWASSEGILTPQNVASAFYCGLDLRTEKIFFDGILEVKASGEYLYSALLDKDNELTYKKRIMWTPDWTCAVSTVVNFFDFRFAAEWNYIGKRYKSNLNVSYMEPYSLVNLNLSYEGFEHFTVYFRAENILDTEYEAVDSYPMPGISATLGLRTKW